MNSSFEIVKGMSLTEHMPVMGFLINPGRWAEDRAADLDRAQDPSGGREAFVETRRRTCSFVATAETTAPAAEAIKN